MRNRLKEAGLECRRLKKAAILTRRHKQERLRWTRAHVRFTKRRWCRVLFTDKCQILLSRAERRGERNNEACIQQFNRWGGGSVHVWTGITQFGITNLVFFNRYINAQTYVQDMLARVVVSFMNQQFQGHWTLHLDNARPHTLIHTRHVFAVSNINVLDLPAMSPDTATIENIWDELKRRIYAREPAPQTVAQLRHAAIQEWQNIPQAVIARVVLSMRERCKALIDARGSYTKY